MSKEFDVKSVMPTNNVMFQMIFGDERHPRILIHFLNSVINPLSPIKTVHIRRESSPNQEFLLDKGVHLDIFAETSDEIINIEMQLTGDKHMAARALFYWSKMFAGQLVVSQQYQKLKRTVSINVLDFKYFKGDDRYWRRGYIADDSSGEKLTNRLEMHFVEIEKMREMRKDSPITFWIEFFRDPYSELVQELCRFVPEIQEAKEVYERAKSDPVWRRSG